MKLNVMILLSAILLITTLSIISAADIDNQTIELNENDDIIESEITQTFDDIQFRIDETDENGTVELEGIYEGNGNPIKIEKSITIQGNGEGATLDAKNLSMIMNITANHVTLNNLKFVNGLYDYEGHNPDGGGSITWKGDYGKLCNATFINSHSTNKGGAVKWCGANFYITNSTFTKCYIGLHDYAVGSGGSLYLDGENLTIDKCNFRDNLHETNNYIENSAIASKVNNLRILNSNFEELHMANSLVGIGGYNCEIKNCTFRNITLSDKKNFAKTIVISNVNNVNISNCTFDNGWAYYAKDTVDNIYSSVYISSSNFVKINNCQFINYSGKNLIYISGSNYTAVENSLFSNIVSSDDLIDIGGSNGTVFLDNIFSNFHPVSKSGFRIEYSPNTLVINNSFIDYRGNIEYLVRSFNDYNNGSKFINCTFPNGFNGFYLGNSIEIIKKPVEVLVDDVVGECCNLGNCTLLFIDKTTNKPFSNQSISFSIKEYSNYGISLRTDDDGKIFLNLSSDSFFKNLPVGVWNVTVYGGGTNYNVSKTFTIEVNKAKLLLDIKDDWQLYVGYTTSVHVYAYLASKLLDNEVLKMYVDEEYFGNATIHNGGALFNPYTMTKPGNISVKICFDGDENFMPTNVTHIFDVWKQPISISTISNLIIDYGDTNEFNVTLRPNYGNINDGKLIYYIDGVLEGQVNVTGLETTISYLSPHAGQYNLTVQYVDSVNFTDSSNVTVTFLVASIQTELELEGAIFNHDDYKVIPITLKDKNGRLLSNLEVELNLNNHTIFYNAVTNSHGIALVNISNLKPGIYNTVAEFLGNEDYYHGFSKVIEIIVKNPTEISIDTPAYVFYSEEACFDVNVSSNVNDGVLALYINGKEVKTGIYNLSFKKAFDKIGEYNITAVFKDSKYYENANKTIKFTVQKMPTTLTVEDLIFNQDDEKTLKSKLTDINGINLSKTVRYNIVNSKGENITKLDSGVYSFTAIFEGDEHYLASQSDSKTIIVKLNTKIAIEAIENALSLNAIVLKANISDDKGNPIEATLKYYINNEQVTNNFTPMTSGQYSLKVVYEGDNHHAASQSTYTFNVGDGRESTVITSADLTFIFNDEKYLKAVLKTADGKLLEGMDIEITINGNVKRLKTDNKGQVSVKVSAIPKVYDAKILFKGNTYYKANVKNVKITVKKATPKLTAKSKTFKIKANKKYVITLKNNKNQPIKKAKVTIKVKGKTYSAKTNNKGKATFKLTKLTKKGTLKSSVKFAGDKYYNSIEKKVKIKIKK